MPAAPNLAGFVDAQRRLRGHFGQPVVFHKPGAATWPAGVPLDPETGRPYDPTIDPVATGDATYATTVNAHFSAAADPQDSGALGVMDASRVLLIADIDERDDIAGATDFTFREERWKVEAMKLDGVGGVQRLLVYGRKR